MSTFSSSHSGVHLSKDLKRANLKGTSMQMSMRIRPDGIPRTSMPTAPPTTTAPSHQGKRAWGAAGSRAAKRASLETDESGSTHRISDILRLKRERSEDEESEIRALSMRIEALEEQVRSLRECLPPVGSCVRVSTSHASTPLQDKGVWLPLTGKQAYERWYLASELPELSALAESQPALKTSFEGNSLYRLASHAATTDDPMDANFIRSQHAPKHVYVLNDRGFFVQI